MDEMFIAARVVTMFLISLGLSGSLPSSASSSSKCAKQMAGFFESGWLALSFLKGKSSPWFGGPSAVGVLELQRNSIESSLSASLAALR